MPISGGELARVERQVRGWIAAEYSANVRDGARFPLPTTLDVTRWMTQTYTHIQDMSGQQRAAIARRVREQMRVGIAMTDQPQYAPGRADLPVDASLGRLDERYRYSVLVTTTAPDGSRTSGVVEIRSDTPLPLAELSARIETEYKWTDYPTASKRGALSNAVADQTATITVLTAGRRG